MAASCLGWPRAFGWHLSCPGRDSSWRSAGTTPPGRGFTESRSALGLAGGAHHEDPSAWHGGLALATRRDERPLDGRGWLWRVALVREPGRELLGRNRAADPRHFV